MLLIGACPAQFASAQVGNLLWEENFDILDTSRWTIDIGDGCAQGLWIAVNFFVPLLRFIARIKVFTPCERTIQDDSNVIQAIHST